MPSREAYEMRPMTSGDLAMVREWRNSDNVRPYMYTTHEITQAEHEAWWARVSVDPRSRHYVFCVNDVPVGVVNIVEIDEYNGTASWGYYIGAENAPPGTGSAMEYIALDMVFGELGIRKLVCEVFAFNKRPLKMHARFGFVQEGVRRAHKKHEDAYEDVIELGVFAEEWAQVRDGLTPVVFRG